MISRSDFMLGPSVIFLNHGSFGALPRILFEEQIRWIEHAESQPVAFFKFAHEPLQHAREALASYVGCSGDDLVFVTNSTYGVNVAVDALCRHFADGEVLTCDHEYGACIRAWERYLSTSGSKMSINFAEIAVPASKDAMIESIVNQMTSSTRVLFLSHITAPTALELPIRELCEEARSRGIITVIDGSHAPGQIELNISELGADVYTANCHKWMCTPKGSAFLYVRKELQGMFDTSIVTSWGAFIRPSAGPFIDENEYLGTRDVSAFLTVPASIEWMQRNNWQQVHEYSRDLRRSAVQRLCAIEGVVGIYADEDQNQLHMGCVLLPQHTSVKELKEYLLNEYNVEVIVQMWGEKPTLRVSTHAHTSKRDIDILIDAVTTYYQKLG